MTEESKILWELEWPGCWKSHAFLNDGSYEGLCGNAIVDFIEGRNPPEEKKCKRCLKILAQKGG